MQTTPRRTQHICRQTALFSNYVFKVFCICILVFWAKQSPVWPFYSEPEYMFVYILLFRLKFVRISSLMSSVAKMLISHLRVGLFALFSLHSDRKKHIRRCSECSSIWQCSVVYISPGGGRGEDSRQQEQQQHGRSTHTIAIVCIRIRVGLQFYYLFFSHFTRC